MQSTEEKTLKHSDLQRSHSNLNGSSVGERERESVCVCEGERKCV